MSGLIASIIRSVGSRRIFTKNKKILLDVVPCEFRNLIDELVLKGAPLGGPMDDSSGFETSYEGVVAAQDAGRGLLQHVRPENLLFVFAERLELINYRLSQCPVCSGASEHAEGGLEPLCGETAHGEEEDQSDAYGIVLCKIRKPDPVEQRGGSEEQRPGEQDQSAELDWFELQEVKERLEGDFHSSVELGVSPIIKITRGENYSMSNASLRRQDAKEAAQ